MDVLSVLGQPGPQEGRRGTLVDGDMLMLGDGCEDAGGVPSCLSGLTLAIRLEGTVGWEIGGC